MILSGGSRHTTGEDPPTHESNLHDDLKLTNGVDLPPSQADPTLIRAVEKAHTESIPPPGTPTSLPSTHWANDMFAGDEGASAADVAALVHEAALSARNDYNEESALTWAQGYTFPAHFIESDRACLRAAQLDFVSMVHRRLKILSPDRLTPTGLDCYALTTQRFHSFTSWLPGCTFLYRQDSHRTASTRHLHYEQHTSLWPLPSTKCSVT